MADVRFVSGKHSHHADRKPLHYAAENRSLQVMALLLNADATEESTMKKVSGMTAWHMAARYGGKHALELLTTRFGDKASGLTALSDTGTSSLAEAILGGNQDSALYLLELTRPDGSNASDPPLIHLSTALGMGTLVSRLIEAGFDPNITSQDGSHALYSLSRLTPSDLVEMLKFHGSTPDHKRDDGKTCLHAFFSLDDKRSPHIPVISTLKETVAKKLLSHSVLRVVDNEGNDPFHYFCTSYLQ
jgi:ankyrin repeat protein